MKEYIKPFDLDHFLYLAIFTGLAILLFTNKDEVKKKRDKISKIILTTSLIQQAWLYGSYLFVYEFDLSVALPLHLSRINTIMGIIFLFTMDKKML